MSQFVTASFNLNKLIIIKLFFFVARLLCCQVRSVNSPCGRSLRPQVLQVLSVFLFFSSTHRGTGNGCCRHGNRKEAGELGFHPRLLSLVYIRLQSDV